MKTNYIDFLGMLLNDGEVVPESRYFNYLSDVVYHLPANEKDVELIRDRLNVNSGDIIKIDGVHYSVSDNIVSDRPFQVTGFTGDVNYGDELTDTLVHDIKLLQTSVSSFQSMSVNVSGCYGKRFPVTPDDVAKDLFQDWYNKSIAHIKRYLAYNLLSEDHYLFEQDRSDDFWSNCLGCDRFYHVYKDFSSLDGLPALLDFNKLLSHIISQFNEHEINAESLFQAAKKLSYSFVGKTSHKAFDKYKIEYSSYGDMSFHSYHYKSWTDALNVCCGEQGKSEFYHRFINDFQNACVSMGGEAYSCGDAVLRKYKEHITLSFPKEISMAIGVFVNKHASDHLQRMVA